MRGILTADIINSRTVIDQNIWMEPLKTYLSALGPTPGKWEIYRGDSFQVEINPTEVLQVAMYIKALVKTKKELDVRIAVGIGDITFQADRLTESNGSAFIRSGEAFEKLKKGAGMTIASQWQDFDEEMNLYLKLANVIMSGWKPATAEIVNAYLNNPKLSQEQLGKRIGMKQPSVSDALSRACYYELMELETYFRKRLEQQTSRQ